MGDVLDFPGITMLDEPPAAVLEKAKDWGLTGVVIVGFDEDGEFVFGGSVCDLATIYWLLSLARRQVMASVPE